MGEEAIRELCRSLLETGWPAYVTTVDREGVPQIRAMFNLRNKSRFPKLIRFFEEQKDDFMLLFTTNTSSTKIYDIESNRAVSVYYCNPETWQGVMFSGLVEIVKDALIKRAIWHPEWNKYYLKGYDDPDHTVLCLHPTLVKGWGGGETFKLKIG